MQGSKQRSMAGLATKVLATILRPKGLESILHAMCANRCLRKGFKLGSLAYAYAAQLEGKPVRMARLKEYILHVHVKETWGVRSYFFRESGAFPIVHDLLGPGDIFIDAGANIGQFSACAAFILGPKGRVFSFEPDPNNRALLQQTISKNKWEGRMKISGKALWKESGHRLKFYPSQNPENTGTASLVQHGVYQDASKFIEVETLTLDDFFEKEQLTACRLMKIDVERAEHELLQGFAGHLGRHAADFILIEMEPEGPACDLLTGQGYEGYQLLADSTLHPFGSHLESPVHDFLFASPGNIKAVRSLPQFKE